MGLREDVLRELVTEYQQSKSSVVFERILKRVDYLLLKTIHMWVEIRPHLGSIDLRDLYHSSIVGLSRALLSTRPQEDGGHIVARIIAYVRNEINVDYPSRRRRRRCLVLPTRRISASISYEPLVELENKLELEEIVTKCCSFLSEDIVDLLVRNIVKGESLYKIAKDLGCSPQNVHQKIRHRLKHIQKEMENGTFD